MRILFLLLTAFGLGLTTKAQTADSEDYKIIFQMVTDDTTAHKAFMKQLNNILSTAPETQIEVVCHGPALNMLVTDKSIVEEKIQHFMQKGVVFNACEFSMSERKVSKEEIMAGVSYVKAGILAIVARQSEGWFYIKAGF